VHAAIGRVGGQKAGHDGASLRLGAGASNIPGGGRHSAAALDLSQRRIVLSQRTIL